MQRRSISRENSFREGRRWITATKVRRPTSGSVIAASVNWPMSAGIPYSSSNANRHEAGSAPPVLISVPVNVGTEARLAPPASQPSGRRVKLRSLTSNAGPARISSRA
jgi:hypothetical protein